MTRVLALMGQVIHDSTNLSNDVGPSKARYPWHHFVCEFKPPAVGKGLINKTHNQDKSQHDHSADNPLQDILRGDVAIANRSDSVGTCTAGFTRNRNPASESIYRSTRISWESFWCMCRTLKARLLVVLPYRSYLLNFRIQVFQKHK